MSAPAFTFIDRELSWVAFNGRVLQEAEDPSVPLFERLLFLAIFSSNLDEFFRVRVAGLRSLLRLKKKSVKKLDFDPATLLRQIHATVAGQQERFGEILRRQILPELEALGIDLLDEQRVTPEEVAYLRDYFEREIRPHVQIIPLTGEDGAEPFLKNRHVYLAAELWPDTGRSSLGATPDYVLLDVPSPPLDRFVVLPAREGRHGVLFLDDVLRLCLPVLFPGQVLVAAYAVKLTRDADLYLDDEFGETVVEKIRKALRKRETGTPSRFLYDAQAPYGLVTRLKTCCRLADDDLFPGGRYHNLHDLAGFPRFGHDDRAYPLLPPLPHPLLTGAPSLFEAVRSRDHLVHVPYQSYAPVVRFLDEAADDPAVEDIRITLYRVARDSQLVQALIRAAERGKHVTAFVEVQARFDESRNLQWAERMEAAGVRTLYSLPGLKVHAKIVLVGRREAGALRQYALLSTGNFNENTARVYADSTLFTADPRLTDDVAQVFAFLAGEVEKPVFGHLLVAPFALRQGFCDLIDAEVAAAESGAEAGMTLKMNSLEDRAMIEHLYRASRAGVPVQLIVRGICGLAPGVRKQSETIRARSIVDRFLEHARVYLFHAGGARRLYLASADWMTRNLDRRVEVAFPLYDDALRGEVLHLLDLQLRDNTKARRLDAALRNPYVTDDAPPLRAQMATYRFLEAAGPA